jgi:hypothetical protein
MSILEVRRGTEVVKWMNQTKPASKFQLLKGMMSSERFEGRQEWCCN